MGQTDDKESMPSEINDPKNAAEQKRSYQSKDKKNLSAFMPEPVQMTPGEAAIQSLKADVHEPLKSEEPARPKLKPSKIKPVKKNSKILPTDL